MDNNPEKNIEGQFSAEGGSSSGGEDRDRYKSLAQKVKEEIFQDLDKYTKASEEMIAFQKANPEVINYELWHTLIGSTPPEKLVFDANDRMVSKFIDGLAKTYLGQDLL